MRIINVINWALKRVGLAIIPVDHCEEVVVIEEKPLKKRLDESKPTTMKHEDKLLAIANFKSQLWAEAAVSVTPVNRIPSKLVITPSDSFDNIMEDISVAGSVSSQINDAESLTDTIETLNTEYEDSEIIESEALEAEGTYSQAVIKMDDPRNCKAQTFSFPTDENPEDTKDTLIKPHEIQDVETAVAEEAGSKIERKRGFQGKNNGLEYAANAKEEMVSSEAEEEANRKMVDDKCPWEEKEGSVEVLAAQEERFEAETLLIRLAQEAETDQTTKEEEDKASTNTEKIEERSDHVHGEMTNNTEPKRTFCFASLEETKQMQKPLHPVNIKLPVSSASFPAATGKLECGPTEAAAVNIQTEKENQSQSTETKGKNKGSGGKRGRSGRGSGRKKRGIF